MNQFADPSQWSQNGQFDPAVAMASEEDFSKYLDLGDMNFDIPMYDPNLTGETQNDQPTREHATQQNINQDMRQLTEGAGDINSLFPQPQDVAGGAPPQQRIPTSAPSVPGSYGDMNYHNAQFAQQHLQQFPDISNHGFQGVVPPTPNSVELHSDAARYLQQLDAQTRAILEQRYQLRKEDAMSFTPLVSPAVTPHDAQFHNNLEFTVPGAYFSPLTSPALQAQNHGDGGMTYGQTTSESSMGTSPVDLDMDVNDGSVGLRLQSSSRKARKTPKSAAAAARMAQSPIARPQRRKTASTSIPPKEIAMMLQEVNNQKTPSRQSSAASLAPPYSQENSEAESVSPEPLSESVMPPPPKPRSTTHSPSILPNGHPAHPGLAPATPASLMRLQQQKRAAHVMTPLASASPMFGNHTELNAQLEDLRLPEAASAGPSSTSTPNLQARPTLNRLDTAIHDDQVTPRMSARKTPKLGPLSTPGSAILSSMNSPILSAVTSPTAATPSSAGFKKSDGKGGRGAAGKKRGSVSSTLVSPALRPKISPSIKPLLPEGSTVSPETHALLLASKSNYQNIIDGTHLPGVSYPEALSTNLTSKRTSHKIAEQGRRNRINTALQEMQSLLPSPAILAKEASKSNNMNEANGTSITFKLGSNPGSPEDSRSPPGDSKGAGTPAQQSNSKAATVESAIDYIKLLKRQNESQEKALETRDKELAELRQQLDAMQSRINDKSPNPEKSNGPADQDTSGVQPAEKQDSVLNSNGEANGDPMVE